MKITNKGYGWHPLLEDIDGDLEEQEAIVRSIEEGRFTHKQRKEIAAKKAIRASKKPGRSSRGRA